MKTSRDALNAIKEFERLRLQAYKCPAGVWTIGYGHTDGVTEATDTPSVYRKSRSPGCRVSSPMR